MSGQTSAAMISPIPGSSGFYNTFFSITPYDRSSSGEGYIKKHSKLTYLCESQEKTLNEMGHLPLISNLSAVGRCFWGVAMIISSLAVFVFSLAAWLFGADTKEMCFTALLYSGHGAANILRAFVESLPFAGNAICFGYDLSGCRLLY